MGGLIALIAVDIVVVVGISVVVGATAPRWPDRWLSLDRFPLHLLPWESARFFRTLRVPVLAKRLPELGEAFGGQSKAEIPGHAPDELAGYLVEVRRAEWVHWLSIASTFPLFAFNPLWLSSVFCLAVTLGNLPFILILRNNRRRLLSIIARKR
jgi:hypothetical protein